MAGVGTLQDHAVTMVHDGNPSPAPTGRDDSSYPNSVARCGMWRVLHHRLHPPNWKRERICRATQHHVHFGKTRRKQMHTNELPVLVEARATNAAHHDVTIHQVAVVDAAGFHSDHVQTADTGRNGYQDVPLARSSLIGIRGEMVRFHNSPNDALELHPHRVCLSCQQVVEADSWSGGELAVPGEPDCRLAYNRRKTARAADSANFQQVAGVQGEPPLAPHVYVNASAGIVDKQIADVGVVVEYAYIAQAYRIVASGLSVAHAVDRARRGESRQRDLCFSGKTGRHDGEHQYAERASTACRPCPAQVIRFVWHSSPRWGQAPLTHISVVIKLSLSICRSFRGSSEADSRPVNQKVAVRMLERVGLRPDVADDGREAVAMSALLPYDLIFMDCQMPEMDGYTAAAEIRKRQKPDGRAAIIAMTAEAMEGARERCLAAGMDDYIAKPVRLDEMTEALKKWVPEGAPFVSRQ